MGFFASPAAQIPEDELEKRAIPTPPPATPATPSTPTHALPNDDGTAHTPDCPGGDHSTDHTMSTVAIQADVEHGGQPTARDYGAIGACREALARQDSSSSRSSDGHHERKGSGRRRQRRRAAVESIKTTLKRPSLTLVNSGSVARDHLASERTFLAYVRTSLAMASMGIALVQLFKLSVDANSQSDVKVYARPLGAVLVITGLLTLATGFVRYFVIQHALIQGQFPVTRMAITLMALVLGIIMAICFGILVGVRET